MPIQFLLCLLLLVIPTDVKRARVVISARVGRRDLALLFLKKNTIKQP